MADCVAPQRLKRKPNFDALPASPEAPIGAVVGAPVRGIGGGPDGASCDQSAANSAPLVLYPYGYIPHQQRATSPNLLCMPAVRKARLAVYPDGLMFTSESVGMTEQPDHLKNLERGEIKGFSAKASARMREFILTHWGPIGPTGHRSEPIAVTLTTHHKHSPAEWRSAIMRFRVALRRKLPTWPALWRVELQRRKAPHLHCIFWRPWILNGIPESATGEAHFILERLWLKATREWNDIAAHKHAVRTRPIENGKASGWACYVALHHSKSKTDQLGWIGKQWGLWNADAWELRDSITEETDTPPPDMIRLRRVLRQYLRRTTHQFRTTGRLSKAPRWLNGQRSFTLMLPEAVQGQLLRIFESRPAGDCNPAQRAEPSA